ncbi:MAG: hypothetical protein COA82_00580 [Alkaliphilus sp.]|nr:hypothetical protein [Alkaliphilus sp. AH-315-G20]PHS36503.1 MAG: hypothetical protein COA82_00580 [Alkaliphilus sp.]
MLVDDETKELIDNNARTAEIKKTSIEHGMITLKENCIDLVLRGLTTIDEMAKVVYSLNGDE